MLLYSMLSTGIIWDYLYKKGKQVLQRKLAKRGTGGARIVLHHIDAPEICALGASRRDMAGAAGGGGVGERCIRPASHRRHR